MIKIESKIKRTIETNKLNPEILGERNWFKYFIRITELTWKRNNHNGYKIEVYNEKYGDHLASITI